jgi:dephospho-CoA kinase
MVNNIVENKTTAPDQSKTTGVATSISERLSQHLVIALVGPVGSGVSTTGEYLREILSQQFAYDVPPVFGLSEVIRNEMWRVDLVEPSKEPLDAYIDKMQTAGNALRKKYGDNYLVEKTIDKIYQYRKDKKDYGGSKNDVPLPRRRAFVLDSLKHLSELELLHKIYGETLCLIGVFAPDKVRRTRLINGGAKKDAVQNVLDRDREELLSFGQQTEKVFVQADFFICNDRKKDDLQAQVNRYLQIIFNTDIRTHSVRTALRG